MTTTTAEKTPPKRLIRTGPLLVGFALSKMPFLHPLMPERLRYELPQSWNLHMLRTFLGSQRKRVYIDVHTRLNTPRSMKPRVTAPEPYRMSEEDIASFWNKGYTKPYTLISPEEMGSLAKHMWHLWEKPSTTYPPGSYDYVGSQEASATTG